MAQNLYSSGPLKKCKFGLREREVWTKPCKPAGHQAQLRTFRPSHRLPPNPPLSPNPAKKMLLPRRLLQWRRPTQSAQALAGRLLRSSSSLSDSDDDPPFTRIPKRPPRALPNPPLAKPKAPTGKIRPDEPAHSDLPFDFRYSYSETDPSLRPIGFREPTRFSPFGPGRLDRPWDGTAAARVGEGSSGEERNREEVLGEPLSEEEVAELVERYRHNDCSRQINLGEFLLSNTEMASP